MRFGAVMFTIPAINMIASDTGFWVETLGTKIRYVEGKVEIHFSIEPLMGSAEFVLYSRDNKVVGPPTEERIGQRIDSIELDRIVKNIREAYRFTGVEIDIL